MKDLISWLEECVDADDVIPGVCYIGPGRGTDGSEWHIHDEALLRAHIGFDVTGLTEANAKAMVAMADATWIIR